MTLGRSLLTVSIFAFGGGCSSPVLIAANDPTFVHAQDRMALTQREVEATGAPKEEQIRFMQAEAMYRYRFLLGRRGGLALTAEAAGAITDLPVFQSFASALDLMALRYQTADAATHLWESFLAHYPYSALRPLTLYRLGWSYRNTSVSGLPRESGDEAFDELAKLPSPSTSDASVARLQDAAVLARHVRWKSKDTAAKWSIVPGLGQIYVGDTGSGIARLFVALAATAAIVTPAVIGLTRSDELSWKRDWPLLVIGVGGLVILSYDYTSSYEDAQRGAARFNEEREKTFETAHPNAP